MVALPAFTLASSSALLLLAHASDSRADRQAEQARQIELIAGPLFLSVDAAGYAVGKAHLASDTSYLKTYVEERRQIEGALTNFTRVLTAHPDGVLRSHVSTVQTTTEAVITAMESLAAVSTDEALHVAIPRLYEAIDLFHLEIGQIIERSLRIERTSAADAARLTTLMTRMIIASIALGIAGAGVAMALLMHTTIRRIRELESNAAALGDGRPLTAIAHSKDELGRLGRGLDQAAVLLHDRDRALRESEERLELALEAADFGTFDVNLTTGQTVWSERAELIHGLPAGGFNGEFDGWIACIHPDDREAVAAAANAPISVGCYRWIEYRVRLADGSMRWVSNRGMGICDELGTPVRIVGTTADVTESKLVQQQLEDMRDSAEHANQSKSEFLSRVSHELRTPLNAILGFGQLLDMDDLTDSQQESVDQVLRGGRHLLALIDDILDISRIESGNLAVSLEPVLVDELIAETISLTRPLAVDQAVTVANANHGSGLFVRADRRRLKQILLNLASNAVKYNVPGGTVTFSVVGTADDVVIAVTDTGIGIREDQLDRVFTPFDRLDADKSGVQGTGMGLALSRSFAELLGGELIATSDFGDGSTFSLRLNRIGDPLHGIKHDEVDASPCVASDAASSFAEGHRRETILHVEDNPSNRKLVEQMLSRRPELRLLAAETVAGALEIARTETLDLVLLDMHLPDGSGADLIPMLRALPNKADLAVVVVSADATPRQIERTTSFGANAYLTKPLDLAHLLSVLERLLPGVTCS